LANEPLPLAETRTAPPAVPADAHERQTLLPGSAAAVAAPPMEAVTGLPGPREDERLGRLGVGPGHFFICRNFCPCKAR
jgi:hypothetical protein